jgi:hypothetical protein
VIARVVIAGLLLCAAARAEEEARTAIVTYVTTSTVYVDLGSEGGVRPGDVGEIRRGGTSTTRVEVTAVSSKRAVCRRSDPDVEVLLGDVVRFAGAGERVVEAPAPAPTSPPVLRRHRARPWRGRVDIQYLGLIDDSSFDRGYSEPGLGLRLDGAVGHGVRLSADMRARRTYRASEDEGRTRVYRLFGDWSRSEHGPRVALGRQISTSIASVSIFDGLLAEWRGHRWSGGAFSGTQPDPESWGYSSDIREHGVWVERGGAPGEDRRWVATLAAIGSYAGSTIDREYLALQGRWASPRVDAYGVQELDVNRGWKSDAGESAVSFTSALVSARWRVSERWSVDGGSDSRRQIRLYADRVTPETEFDDDYRSGHWGGVEFRPVRHALIGASARRSTGGSAGAANSVTLRGGGDVPRWRDLSARARATRYESDAVEGWLLSSGVSGELAWRVRAGAEIGLREETVPASGAEDSVTWFSLDADVPLGGGWFLLATAERSHGDREQVTQLHGSAVWRF